MRPGVCLQERRPAGHSLARNARATFKRALVWSSTLFCAPLSRQQTRSLPFLEPVSRAGAFELRSLRLNATRVELATPLAYPETVLFRAVCDSSHSLRILPSGGISSGDMLLHSGFRQDYNVLGYLRSLFMHKEPLSGAVVASWPHLFLTYGDFVLQLLPQLCHVLSLLDREQEPKPLIVLPRPPQFVEEYLALLGCPPDRLVDSTLHSYHLLPGSRVYFREKDPIWFLCASPELIRLTRECLLRPGHTSAKDLLFVERRGGYRKALGLTDDVRLRLESIGFRFFDPALVPVPRQIEAFSKARVVVGVHGGGLANLLWCQTGTKVVELFHPNYSPPCYAILANHLGMDYYCLGGQPGHLDIRFRESDVAPDWQVLTSLLTGLKEQESPGLSS
jgi:hypothetical protein